MAVTDADFGLLLPAAVAGGSEIRKSAPVAPAVLGSKALQSVVRLDGHSADFGTGSNFGALPLPSWIPCATESVRSGIPDYPEELN